MYQASVPLIDHSKRKPAPTFLGEIVSFLERTALEATVGEVLAIIFSAILAHKFLF